MSITPSKTYILLVLIVVFARLKAQELPLVTELNSTLQESSGLLFLNNTLITHNDSGGTNSLYEVNLDDGSISRAVEITNATNVDWEDLAADDTYIYIADFGNNSGSRTDLKLYRIRIDDFFNLNQVTAEIIEFNYQDQTDFTPNPGPVFTTDYDAEALLAYNNHLYIFTKQWSSQQCTIYQLPITPGNYDLNPVDTLNSNGLITGATKSLDNSVVLLTGYSSSLSPFVIELSGFNQGLFSNGSITKHEVSVPSGRSNQIEAITPLSNSEYYVSAEHFFAAAAGVYQYNSNALSTEHSGLSKVMLYPNPASDLIYFNSNIQYVEVFSMTGQRLISAKNISKLNISNLQSGLYLVSLKNSHSNNLIKLHVKQY